VAPYGMLWRAVERLMGGDFRPPIQTLAMRMNDAFNSGRGFTATILFDS
jgi:hypothetical protein